MPGTEYSTKKFKNPSSITLNRHPAPVVQLANESSVVIGEVHLWGWQGSGFESVSQERSTCQKGWAEVTTSEIGLAPGCPQPCLGLRFPAMGVGSEVAAGDQEAQTTNEVVGEGP